MGRRSRSKRSRKRGKRQERAAAPAVAERPVDELVDAREYDLAIAQLEEKLADHQTPEDRRSLGRVIALKGDEAPASERKELYGAALDHIRQVPAPDDRDSLVWQTRLACLAEEWDTAKEYAELLLISEEDATAFYYRALAAARSWHTYDLMMGEGSQEAVEYLDRALEHQDAGPGLFVYRAKAEGWDDEGRERRRQILEAGRERFPDDPEIAVALARVLRDPERSLELVLDHAFGDQPDGEAVTDAFKYADRTDSDLALRLLDVMERHSSEPWAGIPFLRGRVELDRDGLDSALEYFLDAARRAESERERRIAFESWMGAAAVYVEKKRIDEAFDALVAASDQLFTDFDIRVPTADWVRIVGTLFSLDETKGIDHDIALRHMRAYAEVAFPQSEDALERLDLVETMLHLEEFDCDEPRTFPDVLPNDYRIRRAEAGFWTVRGDYERAFRSALEYAVGAIQSGASEEDLRDSYLSHYWVDEVWDADTADFVEPSPQLKSKFHKAAFDWLERADGADPAHDLVIERVFAPLYLKRWRSYLIDVEAADAALVVLDKLEEWLPRNTVLFDRGYFTLDLPEGAADAEKSYRTYIEELGATAAVANNLAIALARQGRHLEAADSYDLAASMAEDPGEYSDRAEAARQNAEAEERKEKERHQQEQRRREKRENFLASAPERWPQLDFYKRRLLCTLSAISGFESYDELAELAGQEVKYVPGHCRKLEELGMIIEEDGDFAVNPHVMHLVDRERSHAVYTHIIHTDGRIAFKPIFNSRNEYRFYQVLLEIFPNNLVFPNMALQGIFSYDRMKERLDSDEFGYFLRASVDFCITSTASYLPIVAFEADSYWHETERQKERDAMKDKIFRTGGVALIRLRPFGRPSEAALRGDVIRSVHEWLTDRRPEEVPAHGLDPVADLDLSHLPQLAG